MNKKSFIWVTFQKEGIHRYPAAATDPKLATGKWDDVSFLASPHRHIFHFKVWIEVFKNDRDIEFIQFKRWLESLYNQDTLKLDYKSCEMICDELYSQIASSYPNREIKISLAEDNENGAEITYFVPSTTNNSANAEAEIDNKVSSPKSDIDPKHDESKHAVPNSSLNDISFDGITTINLENIKEMIAKAKDNPSGLMQTIVEKFNNSIGNK